MPSAAYSPPRVIAELADAARILRAEGHRVSASRRITIEGLLAADGPVSAEYLAGGLDGRSTGCDLPSAYRNLELFERLGLVHHVHIGHGPGLYALVSETERAYLVCERCGELAQLDQREIEMFRSRVRSASGFEAHFSHFPVLGLCRDCSEGPAEQAGADEHLGAHSHEHSHGNRVHSHPRAPGASPEHEHENDG